MGRWKVRALGSNLMLDRVPFVGMNRTPELTSSVTDGMAISSTSGGLVMRLLFELEFPFSGFSSSCLMSCKRKKDSIGCLRILSPRRLEMIVQGNFITNLSGLDSSTCKIELYE